jgi:hypothetical protein
LLDFCFQLQREAQPATLRLSSCTTAGSNGQNYTRGGTTRLLARRELSNGGGEQLRACLRSCHERDEQHPLAAPGTSPDVPCRSIFGSIAVFICLVA